MYKPQVNVSIIFDGEAVTIAVTAFGRKIGFRSASSTLSNLSRNDYNLSTKRLLRKRIWQK